jgi:SAM-dependent methyltransferase
VPDARALPGTAEALPVGEGSVDAITVAQAFHWFDVPRTLAEFHRVLRPGGRFALIWNRRRREEPLHRAINEITEPYRGAAPRHEGSSSGQAIASSGLFAPAGELTVPLEQSFDADGLVDRIASISFIAGLDEPERSKVLARVRELAADWTGPLRLGYTTEAYLYERG